MFSWRQVRHEATYLPHFSALLVVLYFLAGCATYFYSHVPAGGEFGGRISLEWVKPDIFIYRPDPQQPFYFKRPNGEIIQPGLIYTDGGSIPRQLWSFRGYSPWAFGPGYLIHDWIFAAHYCHDPRVKNYTASSAADVLSECIKALMDRPTAPANSLKNPDLLWTIDRAVRSPVAQDLWDHGQCTTPPPKVVTRSSIGIWTAVRDFDAERRRAAEGRR